MALNLLRAATLFKYKATLVPHFHLELELKSSFQLELKNLIFSQRMPFQTLLESRPKSKHENPRSDTLPKITKILISLQFSLNLSSPLI